MALFQLIKWHKQDKIMVKSGKNSTNLRRLKIRLAKVDKGYIVELNPKGKVVKAVRGFSKQAQDALRTCGMEVLA